METFETLLCCGILIQTSGCFNGFHNFTTSIGKSPWPSWYNVPLHSTLNPQPQNNIQVASNEVIINPTPWPPETNIAPENRPFQKETIVFQPSIFRCELLVSGRVDRHRDFCFCQDVFFTKMDPQNRHQPPPVARGLRQCRSSSSLAMALPPQMGLDPFGSWAKSKKNSNTHGNLRYPPQSYPSQ